MVVDHSIFASSVKQSLWECPIWHQTTPFSDAFNRDLLRELYQIASTFDDASGKKSLLDYHSPCITELMDYKTEVITKTVNQYMPQGQRTKFLAVDTWCNVNAAGERIELHAHPDASVTCSYYIKAPDQGGDFYYVDTGRVGEHHTKIRRITPSSRDLIFFPAYVLHGVEVNQGNLRINLTTDFKHQLTEDSQDRLELRSFVDSMKRIRDL
jgi:hypothetical protein